MATFTTAQQIFTLSVCTYHPSQTWLETEVGNLLLVLFRVSAAEEVAKLNHAFEVAEHHPESGFHRIKDSMDLLESEVNGVSAELQAIERLWWQAEILQRLLKLERK